MHGCVTVQIVRLPQVNRRVPISTFSSQQNVDIELDEIYRAWVEHGFFWPILETSQMQAPVKPTAPDAAERLKAFMRASWDMMEKAHYVRGHLFSEDGQWIETVDKSFSYMTDIHSRDHWEPGASKLVAATDENIPIILKEKRQAVEAVGKLGGILKPETLGIPAGTVRELQTILDYYEVYVRGYELCTHAVYLTRKAQQTSDSGDGHPPRQRLASRRAAVAP